MGCIGSKSCSGDGTYLSLEYEAENPISSLASEPPSENIVLLTECDAKILAASYCRDKSPYTWGDQALLSIGSREHKWHYIVQGEDKDAPRGSKRKVVPFLMVLTHFRHELPTARSLSTASAREVFKSLVCGLVNPYISTCDDVSYIHEKNTMLVTRRWVESGSLRDLVYHQGPRTPYVEKNQLARGRPLPLAQVQCFGRHVLEALSVLNAKGIVADCLTSANVLVVHRVARLADLENSLLGVGPPEEVVELLMRVAAQAQLRGIAPCAFDVQLFGKLKRVLLFLLSCLAR